MKLFHCLITTRVLLWIWKAQQWPLRYVRYLHACVYCQTVRYFHVFLESFATYSHSVHFNIYRPVIQSTFNLKHYPRSHFPRATWWLVSQMLSLIVSCVFDNFISFDTFLLLLPKQQGVSLNRACSCMNSSVNQRTCIPYRPFFRRP